MATTGPPQPDAFQPPAPWTFLTHNAWAQLLPEAGATQERKLLGVGSSAWLGGLAYRSLKQFYEKGPSCSHDPVVIEVARHLLSVEHIAAHLVQGIDKLLEEVWICDCNNDVLPGRARRPAAC